MRLLLDENLSPQHARTLCSLGHDAVSIVDLGRSVNRQRLKINWTFYRLDAASVFHPQLQLFRRSRH